ncbi:unnamed protein product [Paramecium pentaurelia]|uniref:Uncharacterized protein n=1 Tax=Paramecium pentaurelia TaxID=43138 RepID=A0A8S1WUK2_9CILI|nr:unnamed protein product [Paramecium pentaurelia]
MYKLLALSIGSISLIAGKLKIMGGINYFKTHEEISLNDKTILITGGTDGIGWETAKKLAKAKCVIVAGRNVERIKSQLINYKNIKYMYLDLNDLDKVQEFCQEFKNTYEKLDILINNAGIYNLELKYTMQGFEQNFGVNYLSPFLLTYNLLDRIPNEQESRIIFVASRAHLNSPRQVDFNYYLNQESIPYPWYKIYAISKLANVYQASSFANNLKNTQIKVYTLHPGVVRTNMLNQFQFFSFLAPMIWYFTKTPEQGSVTQTFLATQPNQKLKNGYYYKDCVPKYLKEDNNQLFDQTIKLLQKLGYIK